MSLRFEWDEEKRQANLCKHGLDFADAPAVFAGATFTFEDDRFDYEEQQFITLGMLIGRVVVIGHTEQDDLVRIISMRKATRREQQRYFQSFTN